MSSPEFTLVLALKASFVPSGDQSGYASKPQGRFAASDTSVSPEPSTFITYTCQPPSRVLAKATFEPSGDSAGQRLGAGSSVRRVTPLPSGLAMYSSAPCSSSE